jgi:hypothetical protein
MPMRRDRWVIHLHLFRWHLVVYVRDWEFWRSAKRQKTARNVS